MKQVWNVSASPLVVTYGHPATPPGGSIRVEDDVAEQLAAGPDWSFENPRQPHGRKANTKPPVGGEPEAEKAEEKEK